MKGTRHSRMFAEQREVALSFDRPFFGAKVFVPMVLAGTLGAAIVYIVRPPWYLALPIPLVCLIVVFGVIFWWEGRSARRE